MGLESYENLTKLSLPGRDEGTLNSSWQKEVKPALA